MFQTNFSTFKKAKVKNAFFRYLEIECLIFDIVSRYTMIILNQKLVYISIFFISACNAAPTEKKDQQSEVLKKSEDLSNSPDESFKQYQQRSAILNALCMELQTIQNKGQCVGMRSLVDRESISSCITKDANVQLKTTFEVELNATKPVFLTAEPSFTSKESLESGKRILFSWVNKGDKSLVAPRLVDVRQMKFTDAEGNAQSVSSFKLFVNGVEAQSTLTDNNRAVEFSKMQQDFAISDCRMSQTEVDKIKTSALANVTQISKPDSGDLKTLTEILNSQIQAIESELTQDAKRGCWASQKIEKLEIEIQGSVTPVQDGCHPQHSGAEGSPDEIVFKIAGRDVPFTKGQLASGKVLLQRTDFSEKNISELQDFSFAIKGRRIQSVRTPGCGKTLFNQTELDRPVIRTIRIKANDKTIYLRDDFESKFNQTGSYFGGGEVAYAPDGTFRTFEPKIQDNTSYRELLNSSDCR